MPKGDQGHLSAALHFVCGKGGVGRSVVSCVLAKYFAKEGFKTLLVQVNAKDSHTAILGCSPIQNAIQELGGNLHAINVDPQNALTEYLEIKLHSKTAARFFLAQRGVRHFLQFVPSLAELNMLGKIWFHLKENGISEFAKSSNMYDKIVVDCPATGHGLKFIEVAKTIALAVKWGPIAKEAQDISKTIHSATKCRVHVVGWPEELPIQEGVELWDKLGACKLTPGYFWLNGCQPTLFSKIPLSWRKYDAEFRLTPTQKSAGEMRWKEELRQRAFLRKVVSRASKSNTIELPRLLVAGVGPQEVVALSAYFDRRLKEHS